jgi:thioredoxin reductase
VNLDIATSDLPVVVIGAGPQGLAAAAHLRERGVDFVVLEAGEGPAAAVTEWSHVRLFSGWPELIDAAAARLLAGSGWTAPSSGYPTGGEWVAAYLAPLAETLGGNVRYGARVVGVGRKGRGRIIDEGRSGQPFVVHIANTDGTEERLEAQAVIDASGTWGQPNPAGADGLAALGEKRAHDAELLSHRIPTLADAASFAGRHVVVVGNGHSAATAILQLADIARSRAGTRVTWVLRRGTVGTTFGGGDADQLAARGALGTRAQRAVESGLVEMVTGFRVERINIVGDDDQAQAVLVAEDGRALAPADQVFVLTGFRPDLSILSELRLDLDVSLEAPLRLAVEIDPNIHSCGTVRATGAAELAHPEAGFFVVGAKSYGRAPTFLALTGYEQVRSVVAALAGDHEAAARVELKLPATGVCGGSRDFDDVAEGSCCAPTSTGVSHLLLTSKPQNELVEAGSSRESAPHV